MTCAHAICSMKNGLKDLGCTMSNKRTSLSFYTIKYNQPFENAKLASFFQISCLMANLLSETAINQTLEMVILLNQTVKS